MEIRLLGTLEVVVDGVVRPLRGAGERAVLALLALDAGRTVPVDRLVDALWGESLPAHPGNALQTRVSKLRRALVGIGADEAAVATVGSGYRLDVDVQQVDALRFEQQVAGARRLAAQDAPGARERYEAALAGWRGRALLDFADQRWAEDAARRLDELHLAACQERVDLDLQAGRHTEVVGELEALLAAHPLSERLHAQLMLALYRGGRQGDALAVYQRARDALDRELGIDPTAELRELHSAVLRQDPALAAPDVQVVPQPRRGNLPARVIAPIGRDSDLDDIASLLEDTRLVTITGPGGAGKTTLALEVARRLEQRFVDGAWFVDLSPASEPDHVASTVAAAVGLPVAGEPDSRGAVLAQQIGHRRCLLVIDNCEHLVDTCALLVDRLLTACPRVHIVATSREALAVPGEVQLGLAPLALTDAVALFAQRAKAVSRDFALDDETRPHVEEICRHLDGMPLALELAAARTKTLSAAAIAFRLGDRFRLLTGGSRTAQGRHQTLRATVDWSYGLLTEEERVLLRRLSVFAGPWTLETAEEVCAGGGVEAAAVLDLLQRLVDRSLVTPGDGAFRLLETIRVYAAERLDEAGETSLVMQRNAARLQGLAEDCEEELRGPGHDTAMRRLLAEHDDLRAVLAWAAAGGDPGVGQRLAGTLGWFWYFGDHREGRRYLEPLLRAEGTAASSRGRALQALSMVGRPGCVLLHPHEGCAAAAAESIALLESAGETARAVFSKVLLAVEGVAGRDVAGSRRLLDEVAGSPDGGPWAEVFADYVRMKVDMRWGDPDEAIRLGGRAAQRFGELGAPWAVASVRAHLGYDLRILGRLRESLAATDEALEIYRASRMWNFVQMMAGDTGVTRVMLGDEDGARANFAEAIEVCRRHGYRAGQGLAQTGFGYLARQHGDVPAASAHFAQAVSLLSDVGHLTLLAAAHTGAGYASELLGDAEAAERSHRHVLEIAEAVHESWVLACGLEGLAGVALLRGDPAAAAERLRTASALRRETRRPVDPVTALDVDRMAADLRLQLGDGAVAAPDADPGEESLGRRLAGTASP